MERLLEKLCVKKCLKAVLVQYAMDDLEQLVLIVTEMLVSEGLSFTGALVRSPMPDAEFKHAELLLRILPVKLRADIGDQPRA